MVRTLVLSCSTAVLLGALASADTDAQRDAYLKAVTVPRTSDRIAALNRFVASARGTAFEVDALELLVWDRLRTGDSAGAGASADRLITVQPDNALALAVLASAARQNATRLDMAHRGLAQLPRLRQPLGMAASEFSTLKLEITATLNGTAGVASLEARDYGSARNYLRQAVAYFPNNSDYVYSLGVADLLGAEPNRSEAYWYLARAVILTRGTPASQEISAYAYNKYLEDGGTRDDWSRFLVAANASSLNAPAGPELQRASALRPSGASAPAVREAANTASAGTAVRANPVAPRTPAKDKQKAKKKKDEPDLGAIAEEADLARSTPPLPRRQPKLRPMPHPGAPISIGILIGSASGNKADRNAMLDGLSDIVRHLRPGDEAFIMSFSDQLDFEQDLTGNYHLLEKAMDHIPPHTGSALYDAVAFAAGHLRRISKNGNRVLLVISDGRNGKSQISPFQLESDINGIRIDCIGVDVGGDGRYRLSSLASHTGGQAQFISDSRQFEAATQEVAQTLGLGSSF